MTNLQLNFDGQGRMVWSRKMDDVFEQLHQYVRREALLPPAEQQVVPSFSKMRNTRDTLRTYHADWEAHEAIRSERRGDFTNEMKRLKHHSNGFPSPMRPLSVTKSATGAPVDRPRSASPDRWSSRAGAPGTGPGPAA